MDKVTTVGIDLAKNVFSLHGVSGTGQVVLRKTVSRARLMPLVAQLPKCLIAMEACSGAHEWARRFIELGHTVRIIAPKFVVPFRMSGKNDGNDAQAICEAAQRPQMRFVPVKTIEQQAVLTVHRARQGFIEERTATINRIRGLLSEFGVVLPLRSAEVRRGAAVASETLPTMARQAIGDLLRLPRITKRGDPYLRTLLIMGARAALQMAAHRTDELSRWAMDLKARRGYHRAVVALAAKNARILWALMVRQADFRIA